MKIPPSQSANANPPAAARPMSPNVFTLPRSKPKKTRAQGQSTHWVNRPLRFVDAASLCVYIVLLEEFIRRVCSPGRTSRPIVELLDKIHRRVLGFPLHGGGSFGERLESKGMELQVAIVTSPITPPHAFRIPPKVKTVHDGSRPINLAEFETLIANTSPQPAKTISMTDARWRIARRKFSLPGRKWVGGPYLAIVMSEESTGLTARERLWPVWHDSGEFMLCRSQNERTVQAELKMHLPRKHILFAPQRDSDAASLQEALRNSWRGDITKYPYRPDLYIVPETPEGLATVLEVFGVRGLKKYVVGRRKKRQAGSKGLNFVEVDLAGQQHASAIDEAIRKVLEA